MGKRILEQNRNRNQIPNRRNSRENYTICGNAKRGKKWPRHVTESRSPILLALPLLWHLDLHPRPTQDLRTTGPRQAENGEVEFMPIFFVSNSSLEDKIYRRSHGQYLLWPVPILRLCHSRQRLRQFSVKESQ